MTSQPQQDDTQAQMENPPSSSGSINAPRDGNNNPVQSPHNFLAVWLVVNVVSWLIIRTVGSGNATVSPKAAHAIALVACFSFGGSFAGVLCESEEVWTRTSHARILNGVLVFGITAAYSLTGENWNNSWHRAAFALSGWYVGFVLESMTGLFGMILQGLAKVGEEPNAELVAAQKAKAEKSDAERKATSSAKKEAIAERSEEEREKKA